MIQTRADILYKIHSDSELQRIYDSWFPEQQELFLDAVTGATGGRILYDAYFKYIFNPNKHPERLGEILSLLLNQQVSIVGVLPMEGNQLTDAGVLFVMDIVVRLEDGSLANVECQKAGYAFPGERAACYSADLVMREYARNKKEHKLRFHYGDMKNVYTIVFYEKSPGDFLQNTQHYVHHMKQMSDTNINLNLLQEYFFINLDIFMEYHHNNDIDSKLEAWLTFLATDNPIHIEELLRKYPQFQEYYEDVYRFCLNTKDVMNMWSDALREMDRNTVQYMIEEQKEQLKDMQEQLEQTTARIVEKDAQIVEKNAQIVEKDAQIVEKDAQIVEKDAQIENYEREIARLQSLLALKEE